MSQIINGIKPPPFPSVSGDCGCSTNSSCCDGTSPDAETNGTSCCDNTITGDGIQSTTDMAITIDGQVIQVTASDKNIVDVANRAKIGIPAACYRAQRKKGCCHGCVVEIDGQQKFACATAPANGMEIVVDRADLKEIRKKNLAEYNEGIKSGNFCKCSVPGSDSGECSC